MVAGAVHSDSSTGTSGSNRRRLRIAEGTQDRGPGHSEDHHRGEKGQGANGRHRSQAGGVGDVALKDRAQGIDEAKTHHVDAQHPSPGEGGGAELHHGVEPRQHGDVAGAHREQGKGGEPELGGCGVGDEQQREDDEGTGQQPSDGQLAAPPTATGRHRPRRPLLGR